MIKLVFLGTSSMVPTRDRNHTSMLLLYKGEGILIDCGEGTQRQLRKAKISPTKINKILISHWHGDHTLGIPGMIQSLGANSYKKTLEIYGPKGTKEHIEHMLKAVHFRLKIKIKVHEIKKGTFYKNEDYSLSCLPLKHDIPTLAYNFLEKDKLKINTSYTKKFGLVQHPLLGKLQKGKNITYKGKKIKVKDATTIKKGKKLSFILDTSYFNSLNKFAKESDILISEATWEHNKKLEDIHGKKHMSAKESAELAKKSKVKKLILTHFSQRYKTTKPLEQEAKKTFKHTICAKDFLEVSL